MSGREAAASDKSEAPTRQAGAGLRATSLPWAFLHLAVLTAFALGQPLFDLLGKNPEFFAARGSTAGDIVILALLVVVGPPLLGVLIEFLVGLVSKPARQLVHLVFLALLTALGVIQFLKDSFSGTLVLIVAVAGHRRAAGLRVRRAEPVRSFLSVLSPAPLVLLFVFLFVSPVSDIVTAGDAEAKDVKGGSRAPIVFLGLDEFPGTSIMGADGKIDAKRFPGFAELASKSTWFPNAHSIYDSTSRAWPAIMDGELPGQGKAPPDCGRPSRQHLRDPRQEPRDERQRGGHHGLPARPVQGRSPGRAVRRSDPVDHRRPGPGLQAHGRPAGDRAEAGLGVRDLGRLRRRRWRQRGRPAGGRRVARYRRGQG